MISGNGYHGGIVCTKMSRWQEYSNFFILAALGQMFTQPLIRTNSSGQNYLGDTGFFGCGDSFFNQNIDNSLLKGCADIRNVKLLIFLAGPVDIVDDSGL